MKKPPQKPARVTVEAVTPQPPRILLAVCLARLLNTELKARNWTQQQLAEQTKSSRTAVAGWLKERRGTGVDSIALDRIAAGLYPAEHPALAFATLCQRLAMEAQRVFVDAQLIEARQPIGLPGTKGAVNPTAAGVSGLRAAAPKAPIFPPPPPPNRRGRPPRALRSSSPRRPSADAVPEDDEG